MRRLARWVGVTALLSLAACSTAHPQEKYAAARGEAIAQSATSTSAYASTPFSQRIAPVTVLNEHGNPYTYPFLGGFNVPRPRFLDIDADGDLDLFVQERVGELMFLEARSEAEEPEGPGSEQTAARAAPDYVWRTDQYGGIEIGSWYRFTDIDGDGDQDLFTEEPYSYIRYYRNVGTPERARFVLAEDSVKTPGGEPVFADRQNIPNFSDIDCDGLPDLFLGRIDGSITRYELAREIDSDEVPHFRFVTDDFQGISIVAEFLPGGPPMPNIPGSGRGPAPDPRNMPSARHGANSMAFVDVDGDGDEDLLWGDYFEPGVLFIPNRGTCESPSLRSAEARLPGAEDFTTSGYNVPVPVDADADGDPDLYVGTLGGAFNPHKTASNNFFYLENTAAGDYVVRTERYLDGIDVGSESIPALADADGDGDLDLFIGNRIDPEVLNEGRLYYFENRSGAEAGRLTHRSGNAGTPTTPRFALTDTLAISDVYHQAPEFGDLDADGDPDLLVGSWNTGVAYYRNDSAGDELRFTLADSAMLELPRGSHWTPALGDLDSDGDLDLVLGETSGALNYYRNDGTPSQPRFTLVSDSFLDADLGRRSSPALADLDGDGDLDLAVGSEAGELALWRNEGTPREAEFVRDESFAVPLHPFSAPAFADVDGDGALELVAGGESGGLTWWD